MNDGLYEWLAPPNRIQHSLHFAIVQLSFCRLFCIDYQIRWADGVTSGVWRTWRSFLHCSGSKGRLTVREHCDTLMFRLKLGLTQEQVGLSVGEYCGTFLSQTTISRWLSSVLLLLMLLLLLLLLCRHKSVTTWCRFESLNLSYRNMLKLTRIFSGWLQVHRNACSDDLHCLN